MIRTPEHRLHDDTSMVDFQYHLYAPGLSPDFEGALLGRDVLARNRSTGQAVILKAFRRPWQSVLTEDQKDIWRQTGHPALASFLRTEPSLSEGTLYAYHAYQFEPLGDAAEGIREAVNYLPAVWAGHFAAAADALHTLAGMGVNHGAINPESLVVTRVDSRLRLKDFGLAVRLGEDVERGLQQLLPCFPYIAPEVFDALVQGDDPEPTLASDVYSFGAVLHDFFFGRPPLDANTAEPRDLVVQVLGGELDLQEQWHDLPLLTAIIHRCLHPDPAERYQSFASLSADLHYASELRLEFVGEDVFGLRFVDARHGEVRVLPECLTLSPPPAGTAEQLGLYLPPDWRVDAGTRTVVRTDLAGLEPLSGASLPLNVWEFHFLQGLSDLVRLDDRGPLFSHMALLWLDPVELRVFHLYPGLRPRSGQEAALIEWLQIVAETGLAPILAPEVIQHARALAEGAPVVSFDQIDPESCRRSALFNFSRLVYALMTGDQPVWSVENVEASEAGVGGDQQELPAAYTRNQDISMQMSELLAGTLHLNPAARTESAAVVINDYQARSARLRKAEPDAAAADAGNG